MTRCRWSAPPRGATGSTVSSVKAKAVTAETLPATSVCRTSMVLAPCTSCAAIGALVDQVVPPSSEYSTFAPGSMLLSVSAGLLVMWSLLDDPVSLVSATPGAIGRRLVNRQGLACFRRMVAGLIRHVGFDGIAAIGQMIAARHRHRPGIAADNGVEAEQHRVGTVDDRDRRDLSVGNPGGGAVDRNPAAASAALTTLSPAIGVVIVIESAAVLTVRAWLASLAALPASSDTSALTV